MIFASVEWNASLFVTSLLLGVALAMDAFSVSIADAFADPTMSKRRSVLIAGTFAFFQAAMPMLGWVLVHFLYQQFAAFRHAVPWIALILLSFLGIKMIISYRKHKNQLDEKSEGLPKNKFLLMLLVQALATSIDALSVGLNTASYDVYQALVCSCIIAGMTFIICIIGIILGKKIGPKVGKKAELIGGIILLFIGVYIFSTGLVKLYVPPEYIPHWLDFII